MSCLPIATTTTFHITAGKLVLATSDGAYS